jgi:hypothetical protein
MKVNYEKTNYEQLVDILETAFHANRDIKSIEITTDEYKRITKSLGDPKFLQAINRKVLIKDCSTIVVPDLPLTCVMAYQVVDSWMDQSARLCHVKLVIL